MSSLSQKFASLAALRDYLMPYRWRVTIAMIALVLTAGITLSIGQGLRILIDQGFSSGSMAMLNQAIAVFATMILLLAAGTFVRFYLVSWIGERVSADLRKAVFQHIVQLHPGFFETQHSGAIQSRITTDTTILQNVIGSSVSIALRNILMLIGSVSLLLITNIKLSAIVLACVPLVVVPIIFFGRKVRSLSRSSQDRVADVGAYVGEVLTNIKTVQAFNHEREDVRVFDGHVESAFATAVRRIRQRAILMGVVILLVFGAIAAMMWVGGRDVITGAMSPGDLAAFVFYAMMVAASVGALSEVMTEIQRAAGAVDRLMELLRAKSLIRKPSNPNHLPAPFEGAISMSGVTFCYPSRPDTPAIDALNLDIEPGTSLALVGHSGAGKTTLFNLLLRFYDPSAGTILLDGVDIKTIDPNALRQHIAIVSQQPTVFSSDVWTNIRYGRLDATDAEVMEAAKAAYADEFIEKLPEGYNSFLGESGVRLSGGQRQRIAIARAVLKDPEILLLDEATSSLDAQSEKMVQKALSTLMRNRTTLVIAHRLATVISADKIAVFDDGKIIDVGTHSELSSRCALYKNLSDLQFREPAQDTLDDEASSNTAA